MRFSIVIPCQQISHCLRKETLPAILAQKEKSWEIIIIPDQAEELKFAKTKVLPLSGSPAEKRNLGIKQAGGEIIVFIDDDAYPDKNWLRNISRAMRKSDITAVVGPGLTPPQDSFRAKVSGWFWASPLGSGGAGQYRCWPQKERLVDDYPTFNLAVKKTALDQIGGFSCQFWPGEDTKLCLDLVYQLEKQIVYQPQIVVFHHRRPIFGPHLKQIGRYGYQRGLFAKIFPQTSKRLGYFLPAFFALGLLSGLLAYFLCYFLKLLLWANLIRTILFVSLGSYIFLLLINSLWVLVKSKNPVITLLLLLVTPVSHFYYGVKLFQGLVSYSGRKVHKEN